jgi:hypothetical protein
VPAANLRSVVHLAGDARIEYVACTSKPDGRWITQQARNLAMQLGHEHAFRFLVHDRDAKFSHGFDEIFRTEGITVIRTPIQAPNANAHAERWVRTLRADCLDRIIILGRRTSNTSSASTVATTTSTGRTAPSTFYHRTAATQRCRTQLP